MPGWYNNGVTPFERGLGWILVSDGPDSALRDQRHGEDDISL
jgi:hypothetical protein